MKSTDVHCLILAKKKNIPSHHMEPDVWGALEDHVGGSGSMNGCKKPPGSATLLGLSWGTKVFFFVARKELT